MKVIRSGKFRLMLVELGEKSEEMVDLAELQIRWFRKNPEDTRLRIHALRERMEGKWAFSVTGDTRIVFEWLGKNTARLLAIGPHKVVYERQKRR